MPFAQNWAEELVAEWLCLCGYVVESGLPVSVSSTGVGGRFCADVVGAKALDGHWQIVHVEVGGLAGSIEADCANLLRKFSLANQESIEKIFRTRLGIQGDIDFKKMYVATFCTPGLIERARSHAIDFCRMEDFIRERVLPEIEKWKVNPAHKPKTKGNYITLPEAHWLLKLIEFMSQKRLLTI